MPVTAASAFLVYVLINAFTPGPGNILALNTAVSYGWDRAKKMYFGIFTGYYAVQILCALFVCGLQAVLSPFLDVVRYIGAAYIVFLAVCIAVSRPGQEGGANAPRFARGFLLQFVNVKIYLFGITALTLYVLPYYASPHALLLAEIFIATVGTIATLSWTVLGRCFQDFCRKHARPVNIVLALTLVMCAVSIFT